MDKKTLKNDDAVVAYLKSISNELLRVAYSYIKDDSSVDDVISETVYRVLKYRKKMKQPEFFKTWVIRILINECKSELARINKMTILDEERVPGRDDADYSYLYECIDRLEDKDGEIVRLKTLDDYTFAMIADILEMNENTVKTNYYRAIERLRKEMLAHE